MYKVYYLVNKSKNDEWLEKGSPKYTYLNRPWAEKHASLDQAIEYAEGKHDKENWEIEAPNGSVYGYTSSGWSVVFD